jgi:predicted nuclease with TOPRIM domain
MTEQSESDKRIIALSKKLDELTDQKIALEIELGSIRSELSAWKERYATLSENVLRMGKNPEQLTATTEERPKPKSRVNSSNPEDLRDKISIGEAVKIAVENDLIKKGPRMQPGSHPSDSQ